MPPSPEPHRETHRLQDVARKTLVVVAISLAGIAVGVILWNCVRVLLVGFAGILLAVLFRTLARYLHRWTRLPMGWSLAIAIVLLFATLVGVGMLLAPDIVERGVELSQRLPQAIEKLRHKLALTAWGKQVVQWTDQFTSTPAGPSVEMARQATSALTWSLNLVLDLVLILFLGIFLAAQPALYVDGFAALFPRGRRARLCEVLHRSGQTLRRWLLAQIIDMFIIGIATWLGLWALGVPLAPTLGVLAGLFNFIPNFGPLFSYVPAMLLALVDDPSKALYVTILFIVLQTLEGYILLPLLQRGAVDTPPAVLILGQVLFTLTAGMFGLALAAPLIACAIVLVRMLYMEDVLGASERSEDGG